MPRRKSVTAAELANQLSQDTDYQARMRELADQREQLERECADDEAKLVAELVAAGSPVKSVWDLVALGSAPKGATAVLVHHLLQPHHPRVWDVIVRALSSKAARDDALEPLKQLYRSEANPSRRWVLANAIGSMALFTEVADLPGICEYRALFRQTRKPAHIPPAI